MIEDKKALLKEIKKVLRNYKDRNLRIGLRMNGVVSENKFKGFVYEGPILDVKEQENELHIKLLDKSNPLVEKYEEKTIKLLAYEKPIYDDGNEFELQDIEHHERKDFQGYILEIKTGQNKKIERHLFIRN